MIPSSHASVNSGFCVVHWLATWFMCSQSHQHHKTRKMRRWVFSSFVPDGLTSSRFGRIKNHWSVDWFCLLLDFCLGKEILQCILLEFPDFKARGGTNILEFILFECVLDLLHFFCSIKYVKSMCCVAFVNFKFIYFSRRAHSHPKPSIPHSWNQR